MAANAQPIARSLENLPKACRFDIRSQEIHYIGRSNGWSPLSLPGEHQRSRNTSLDQAS